MWATARSILWMWAAAVVSLPELVFGDDFDFEKVTLEELTSMEITSASKRRQRLSDTASAIFVITAEDIRRSGHTTIPEALRLAPGVQVERVNSSSYAISVRGFEDLLANKLLVLIDGRSVYSTIFSGVQWDQITLPVSEVDRIEIIRGPGATVWGANAVNGVINILTKRATELEGSELRLRAGNQEQLLTELRHGVQLGENLHARITGSMHHLNDNLNGFGDRGYDDARRERVSSRIDWNPSEDDELRLTFDWFHTEHGANTLTFRDDFSDTSGTLVESPSNVRGQNGNLAWTRKLSEGNSIELSATFERLQRNARIIEAVERQVDLELQQNLDLSDGQKLTWGVGARRYDGRVDGNNFLTLEDPDERLALYHAFAQDEIQLTPSWMLTLGSKVSWNDYTGWEIQPSIRSLFKPGSRQSAWAAISRAVRTPARSDRSSRVTVGAISVPFPPMNVPIQLRANPDSESEVLLAYELGYRAEVGSRLSLDLALFVHDYENLIERQPSGVEANRAEERSHGAELAFNWFPASGARVRGAWSMIHLHHSDRTPHQSARLHGSYDLTPEIELDLGLYYDGRRVFPDLLGGTNTIRKGGELRTDARVCWKPRPNLSIALVGQNLFDRDRVESFVVNGASTTRIQRSVFVEGRVRF